MKVYTPTQEEIKATESWDTWSKEKSKFDWYYDQKETCYILEGEASVTDKNGNSITFTKGDMLEFPAGLSCEWNITKEIKKKYLFS